MTTVLSEQAIKDKLQSFRAWELSGGQLEKTYSFADFKTAMEFVNKAAMVAESQDHHPDILIKYNKVTCMTSTHSENGITDKDFALIKQLEKLAVETI